VEVDLPHPRNRSDPAFIALRDDVLGDFLELAPDAPPALAPPSERPAFSLRGRLQLAW
jgi:sulfonate transport system ATP-binding protein